MIDCTGPFEGEIKGVDADLFPAADIDVALEDQRYAAGSWVTSPPMDSMSVKEIVISFYSKFFPVSRFFRTSFATFI